MSTQYSTPCSCPTVAERNHLVLSLLEDVTPLIRKYTAIYGLDFEEMYQDASIIIMRLLDVSIDAIYDLRGYVAQRVKSRMIDKLRYTQRRCMVSLDAPLSEGKDAGTLADLLPSPYQVEPLTILLAQERLQELSSIFGLPMRGNRRRVIWEQWESAVASLCGLNALEEQGGQLS